MIHTSEHTILIVEDSENDVLLLRHAFKRAQATHPLQVVSDGEKALDYLSGAGSFADRARFPLPELILLDLKLPRKSGHEVLAWIRAQPTLGLLPVVVLTSSRETRDINEAYAAGANTYLVKPPTLDDLSAMVKTLHLYWFFHGERPKVLGA